MINNRLLNEFKSTDEKERTIIIKDIKCDIDSWGQEVLSIITDQISTPPSNIEKGYDITQKTLEVEGHLDLNDNKEYYTNLVGFVIDGKIIQAEESMPPEYSSEENVELLEEKEEIDFIETNTIEGED